MGSSEDVTAHHPLPAVTRTHRARTKEYLMMAGKVAGTIVTALATSYYAYRTTKVEGESKVALAKVQAEAGYSTLLDAVEKLTKAAEQNRKTLDDERLYSAKLEGRIISIEGLVYSGINGGIRHTPAYERSGGLAGIGSSRRSGFGAGSASPSRPAPVAVVRPAIALPPLPKRLPPTLDEATVQVQQQQMEKAAK